MSNGRGMPAASHFKSTDVLSMKATGLSKVSKDLVAEVWMWVPVVSRLRRISPSRLAKVDFEFMRFPLLVFDAILKIIAEMGVRK
jgi:hypothetical protein